jgi:hypothetical protein
LLRTHYFVFLPSSFRLHPFAFILSPSAFLEPPMSTSEVRLGDLAHARSGDKGNRANIGVVANDPDCYAWLDRHLTEESVAEYLRPLGIGQVRRFSLPKIGAFNFVIDRALGGGASRSLRLDSQGKALGAALLEFRIPALPRSEEGA